jgi:hypothetical protein
MQLLSCVHPTHTITKTTIPVDAAFRLQIARSVEDLKGGTTSTVTVNTANPTYPQGSSSTCHVCILAPRSNATPPWSHGRLNCCV